MAFSDPQSITIDGTTHSLPRILTGTSLGKFVSADASKQVELLPTAGKGRRNLISRLRFSKVVADPLVTTTNVRVGGICVFSVNVPTDGSYTDDDILKEAVGFIAWLTAGTNANLKRLIAGEN